VAQCLSPLIGEPQFVGSLFSHFLDIRTNTADTFVATSLDTPMITSFSEFPRESLPQGSACLDVFLFCQAAMQGGYVNSVM
jgi:hypothetical protein